MKIIRNVGFLVEEGRGVVRIYSYAWWRVFVKGRHGGGARAAPDDGGRSYHSTDNPTSFFTDYIICSVAIAIG